MFKTFIQKVEADVVRRTFNNYEELKAANPEKIKEEF